MDFSAKPEPLISLKPTDFTILIPLDVLTSSRQVDEWKTLLDGERARIFTMPFKVGEHAEEAAGEEAAALAGG